MLRLVFGAIIVLGIFFMSPERRFDGGLPGNMGRAVDTTELARLIDRTVSRAIQTSASATLPRWIAQSSDAVGHVRADAFGRRDVLGEVLLEREETGARPR